jgi:hypothetical protein
MSEDTRAPGGESREPGRVKPVVPGISENPTAAPSAGLPSLTARDLSPLRARQDLAIARETGAGPAELARLAERAASLDAAYPVVEHSTHRWQLTGRGRQVENALTRELRRDR